MTDDLHDGVITPPMLGGGDPYGDLWEAIWADFDARHAENAHGTRQVLVGDELEAGQRSRTKASFEAQSCAERIDPAFRPHTFIAYDTTKPFLTTREAAAYCGFRTSSALRKAKLEGRIVPAGRRGGTGTLMWSREALDRYLQGSSLANVPAGRARTPPEATGGTHDETEVGSEVEQLGGAATDATRRLSAKGGRFLVRGRAVDPKNGATRQVVRNLPDLKEPEEARLHLKAELDSIRKGARRPTTRQPERLATYAASLLREKVEKRQICSSTTEEKWMFALRHIFGLKDDKGTLDVGIKGLGDIFVDKVTRADVEAWRDSWEPRINAGAYAPTTVNDWIAVLRVITKKMKADYGLPVDPCADVEAVSTKGHRTFTFEQPNSLGTDEAQRLLRDRLGEVPAALRGDPSRLGHRATPLEPLRPAAVRRERRREVGPGPRPDPTLTRHQGPRDGADEDQPRSSHQAARVRDVGPSLARRQAARHPGDGAQRAPVPLGDGRLPSNSALAAPFRKIAKAMGLKKQISPKAMRRSFQDAMREAQVANVVVRSISGHLTDQMQQRYSTARGHEQESAIARIIDLTRVQRRVRGEGRPATDSNGSRMDSKVDSMEGQHKVSG